MALSELQRKKLIEGINSIAIASVMKYIQSGDISLEDVPNISAERKQYILNELNNMPNPMEQQEWQLIEEMLGQPSPELLNRLTAYINKWNNSRPAGNHVDLANQKLHEVESQIKIEAERVEQAAWDALDTFSVTALREYLTKYPNTIHKSEIDDCIWGLTDQENVQMIQNYLTTFPYGVHTQEAQAVLNSIVEWNNVKQTDDVFCVNSYILNNPKSPFIKQAQIQLMGLKQRELSLMRDKPNSYEVSYLMQLIDKGIFSEMELINADVVTETILETLRNNDVRDGLPDIMDAIEESTPDCEEGRTDVFFFGVPATGKTCVLMGLSRTSSLHINLASGGGDYAAVLQQYTDAGLTVPPTPGDFVTTIRATIGSRINNQDAVHKINLVEMSGEEFAFGIANNPDHEYTFEHMGSGTTKLLSNDNNKVFFLIIDPTTNVIRKTRTVMVEDEGYDEETGKKITHQEIQHCIVNQRTIIQKMVNIFEDPTNAEIMKKVNAIHIIMTKSDTLGSDGQREEKALEIFNQKYSGDLLESLYNLGKEYNINSHTDFYPNLYTFSLGKFYVGGLYEYEQIDSDKLVSAIQNATIAEKKRTWWDKVKDVVNNPII